MNAILAIINHNDPNHPNWKGNNRPAVINASVGVNIPSENYQFVPQNEPGFDSGAYEADTAMDDYEKSANDAGIVFVRSAGNGFGYNVQYGGYQASSTLVLVLLVLRTISTIWKVFVTRSLWVQPR